jgi:hypothetical protein
MIYVVTDEAMGWLVHWHGPPRRLEEMTQDELKYLREQGHPGIKAVKDKKKGGANE